MAAYYSYDPEGRRTAKIVNGVITYYAYDGDNLAAEYNASGTVIARYIHTPGSIDRPLAMQRGGQMFYYVYDGHGSVIALTNAAGKAVQRYEYDSYGRITLSEGGIANPYTYTGREFDPETGLYYYRARYYDPDTGRFLQQDPVWATNLYAYTDDNPINRIDPMGKEYLWDTMANIMSATPSDAGSDKKPSSSGTKKKTEKSGKGTKKESSTTPEKENDSGSNDTWISRAWNKTKDFWNEETPVAEGKRQVKEKLAEHSESNLLYAADKSNNLVLRGIATAEAFTTEFVSAAVDLVPETNGQILTTTATTLAGVSLAKRGAELLKGADECIDLEKAAQHLDDAGDIMPYKEAKKLTKGKKGELQAHELFEFRHQKSNGMPRQARDTVPTNVLQREEHQAITNTLRDRMPYGDRYDVDRVMSEYNDVYSAQELDSISTWLGGMGL